MELLPEVVSGPLRSASVVFHASYSGAIVTGKGFHVYKRCENSTTNNLLQSYTATEVDETKEWLELSINLSYLPCSDTEKCIFSAQTTGNCSLLDAILVIYDYSEHGDFDISRLVSKTIEKRSAASERNRTLLSEYTTSEVNCSVQSVFLDYATDFPVFPEHIAVLAPSSIGVNMTFCFGICYPLPVITFPFDINGKKRHNLVNSFIGRVYGPTPRVCCIPDTIEHDGLMVFDSVSELVELQTFPQVKTCHCVL